MVHRVSAFRLLVAATVAALVSVAYLPAVGASSLPDQILPRPPKPTTTTKPVPKTPTPTTKAAPATTVTIPAGAPPIDGPPTTNTTPRVTAPPPDPIPIITAVESLLIRVEALARVPIETAAAGQADASAAGAQASADVTLQNATKMRDTAQRDIEANRQKVAGIAAAVYANPLLGRVARPGPNTPNIDGTVILPIIFKQVKENLKKGRERLTLSEEVAERARELARQAAEARKKAADARDALGRTQAVASGRDPGIPGSISPRGGPSILGPVMVTAGEMAAWFIETGHRVGTRAAVEELAGNFASKGVEIGVRGDIAFTQSILETGWFSFPGGGQLNAEDHNFAGIGACDSCSHGFIYKDVATGVQAQLELLRAYASTQPTPTPALGKRVSVRGCCATWMALTGVWATSTAYGVSILTLYEQLLQWVIAQRVAIAGLT